MESTKIYTVNNINFLISTAQSAIFGFYSLTAAIGTSVWNALGSRDPFFFLVRNDGTNKLLSRDSNHIVIVVMWPKFGNSSTFMRELIINSILQGFDQKIHFFGRVALVQFNKIGTVTRYSLQISHQCSRSVKTKSQNVLGANSYIYRSCRGKYGRGTFYCRPPFWIGLIIHDCCFFRNIFIYLTNFFSNPNIFSTIIKNWWWKESKTFSVSFAKGKPFVLKMSFISKMSDINRPPSLIILLSIKQFHLRILKMVNVFSYFW